MATVRLIPQDNINFVVLEGFVEGYERMAYRRAVSTLALADGQTTIEAEKGALIARVEQRHARWLAQLEAIKAL